MRPTTIVGELPSRQTRKAHRSPPELLSSTGDKRASKWMPTDGSMAAHLTRRRPRQVPSLGQLVRGYATLSASERGCFGHQGCNTGQTVGSHLELFIREMHQALPPGPTPSHIHWKLFCITAKSLVHVGFGSNSVIRRDVGSMSALLRLADSSRTSPEVREVQMRSFLQMRSAVHKGTLFVNRAQSTPTSLRVERQSWPGRRVQ
jgi:hypothetical protein